MKTSEGSFSIGKKIGLGFALVLAILVLTGLFATISMRSASQGARELSDEHLPEFSIASTLSGRFADVRLAARTYGNTQEDKYRDEAAKGLLEMQKIIADLESLSERSSNLTDLKRVIRDLPKVFSDYAGAFDETQKAITQFKVIQDEAIKIAKDTETSLQEYLHSQQSQLRSDADKGREAAGLKETMDRIDALNAIILKIYQTRLAYYQAMRFQNAGILQAALNTQLAEALKLCEDLRSRIRGEDNAKHIDALVAGITHYREKIDLLQKGQAAITAVMDKRTTLANKLDALCVQLMKDAEAGTATISKNSTENLGRTSTILVVTVILAVIVGVLIAVGITRIIVKPLTQAVDFVMRVANRDLTASMEVRSGD